MKSDVVVYKKKRSEGNLVQMAQKEKQKLKQQEEEKKLIQAERQAKQEKELAFRGNKQEVPEKTQDY